ncbi:MAG: diacylglycerol kinase family lipid kinase [Cellulosilyticum sp.]|nr:diacylglycerol kinase family lipid kinase [Cellulosilyticum sp.]
MKALFVVNPAAGKGRGLALIKSFEPIIQEKIPYEIVCTGAKGEATEIVRRYTLQDDYLVFAVGGDGTINEVVNGIVGSKSSLAILPTGSGNDFVRSLYEQYTLEELLIALIEGKDQNIDVMQINERYFLNITSVGLDADVVYNASYYKKKKFIKGDMAYVISLIKTVLGPKGTYAKVMIDGSLVCDESILLLAAANGSFYGGGIHMVPTAKVNDGLADICLIRETRLRKLLKLVPSLIKAKHTEAKEVEIYHAKEILIEARDGCRVNIDGEIVSSQKIGMKVIPNGIKVRVPHRNLIS